MKRIPRVATLLAAMLIPTGAAMAQQWGGVAGIAAGQGYSASPFATMSNPPTPMPDAAPAADDRPMAAAGPRVRAPRAAVADLRADRPRHRYARVIRTAARPHPAMVARAKRMGIHRRARIA